MTSFSRAAGPAPFLLLLQGAAAVALVFLLGAPGAALALTGGPDAFGYSFIDSDEPGGPVFDWFDWFDEPYLWVQAILSDEDSEHVPIGFDFEFYGTTYQWVYIQSNGALSLTQAVLNANNTCPMPHTSPPDEIIAVYWDDMNPEVAGNVYYGTVGNAPHRVFVVSWSMVPHYGGIGGFSFQAQLFETSNKIVMLYNEVTLDPLFANGVSATSGIQSGQSNFLEYHCDSAALHNGLAVQYGTCSWDDLDLDGYSECDWDCDDGDDTVFPGNLELCDAKHVDNDCDPATDELLDGDTDTFSICGADGLPSTGDEDCDDGDATVHPGAIEICDGLDNDCDGSISGPALTYENDSNIWFSDSGSYRFEGESCLASTYTSVTGIEAYLDPPLGGADFTWMIYEGTSPSGPFVRIHENTTSVLGFLPGWFSSGTISVPLTAGNYYVIGTWWSASYTVGYWHGYAGDDPTWGEWLGGVFHWGAMSNSQTFLPAGAHRIRVYGPDEHDGDGDGWMLCAGDCDDGDPTIHPSLADCVNGIDNNCDGTVDEDATTDGDGDGWGVCVGDCDDGDPAIHPGVQEACDGIDTDCDGAVPADEVDADQDGYLACEDCDDGSVSFQPGGPEWCDGLDNDCDGVVPADEVDSDGDGWSECEGDCGEGDPLIYPGAPEFCDGINSNCDNFGPPLYEVDWDGDGWMDCEGDCAEWNPLIHPGAVEDCGDGVDNDCDGDVDGNDTECAGDDDTADDDAADDDAADDDTADDDTADDDTADDDAGDDDTADDDTADDDTADDDAGDDDTADDDTADDDAGDDDVDDDDLGDDDEEDDGDDDSDGPGACECRASTAPGGAARSGLLLLVGLGFALTLRRRG